MANVLALGPWGNEEVRNWSFRFFEGQTLAALKIRHGDVVDRITFVLMDKNGHTSEESAGGEGGKSDEIIFNIAAGEFITKISGQSANYSNNNNGDRCISSITIHTNLNKSGYGPYGPGTTAGEYNVKDFSSPPLFTNAIVGFHGGANQYLESIGIYVNPDPVKLGPWGNMNSLNWDLKLADDQVLKKLIIHHGYVVDAIAFVVGDQNSDGWEVVVGGDGGSSVDEIPLGAKEYVTQISGTVANYSYDNDILCITSIAIHTNLNPNGYGPYGLAREEGKDGAKNLSTFSSPLMEGDAIIGFYGGANKYIESIGIYVAPMGRSTLLMRGNK